MKYILACIFLLAAPALAHASSLTGSPISTTGGVGILGVIAALAAGFFLFGIAPVSTGTGGTDPTTGVTPWYLDKALWLTVLTPILALAGTHFGLNLDAGTIVGLILPVVTYIVMHKWKTTQIMVANANASAVKAGALAAAKAADTGAAAAMAQVGK